MLLPLHDGDGLHPKVLFCYLKINKKSSRWWWPRPKSGNFFSVFVKAFAFHYLHNSSYSYCHRQLQVVAVNTSMGMTAAGMCYVCIPVYIAAYYSTSQQEVLTDKSCQYMPQKPREWTHSVVSASTKKTPTSEASAAFFSFLFWQHRPIN